MNNGLRDDQGLMALEIARIQSEIERNNAERDSLRASQKRRNWQPYVLAIAIATTFVVTFSGFFADLYQIALTDREALRHSNEKLLAENGSLAEAANNLSEAERSASALAKQLENASTASVNQEIRIQKLRELIAEASPPLQAMAEEVARTYTPMSLTEPALYNAILVTWWDPKSGDAIVVSLNSHPNYVASEHKPFAEGVQLGEARSDLGLKGGGEWAGWWQLKDGCIRITETFPRPLGGLVIEVDISRGKSNGRWQAIRTRGAVSEIGSAEVIFPATTSPRW